MVFTPTLGFFAGAHDASACGANAHDPRIGTPLPARTVLPGGITMNHF